MTGEIENIAKTLNLDTTLSMGEKFLEKMGNYLQDFFPKLVLGFIVFYIGFKIVRIINYYLEKSFAKLKIDPMIKSFIFSIVSVGLKLIVIIIVAGIIGIKSSSFLALFTAAGVAIGMSLSGTLQNFAGGLIIVFFKLYKIGDFISIGGADGTVKSIHIFHTVIETVDRKTIIVPNAQISNGTMINFSNSGTRRVEINIGVDYNTDIELVKKVFREVIEADPRVLTGDKNPVSVFLGEFQDSALLIVIRYYVKSADYFTTIADFNERLLETCRKNNINIPFPQRDVHIINK